MIIPKDSLLKNSFSVSYLVLFGYTIITLVEAIRTPHTAVRHIMNIETAVSIIAGFVYGQFLEMVNKGEVDSLNIMQLRYVDWSITTPLILLALLLFYNSDGGVSIWKFLAICALNYGMLGAGYLGEAGTMNKIAGNLVGFVFFLAMIWLIWNCCVSRRADPTVFWIFTALWTGYGIAYWLDEVNKNIAYNFLDVSSKAIFGMMLWLYFGHVVKF